MQAERLRPMSRREMLRSLAAGVSAVVESDPENLKNRLTDWPALFEFSKQYAAKRAGSSLLPRPFFDVFIPQLIQQGGALGELEAAAAMQGIERELMDTNQGLTTG